MMLMPSIFGEGLLDDWFDFPQWPEYRTAENAERKLYGRHPERLMRTDVHEHEDHFDVDIDLPGFKKEEIHLELEKGYLTVLAAKEHEVERAGKPIRKERYSGSMKRTFFVGEQLTEEDIRAKFEDGVLSLEIPKKTAPKAPEKRTIMIQ